MLAVAPGSPSNTVSCQFHCHASPVLAGISRRGIFKYRWLTLRELHGVRRGRGVDWPQPPDERMSLLSRNSTLAAASSGRSAGLGPSALLVRPAASSSSSTKTLVWCRA